MSKAVYSGSFNPLTCGHWDIITQACGIFDKLYVVIAQNADKDNNHTSIEAMAKDVSELGDVVIHQLMPNELLVDMARNLKADYLVRGLRGVKDFMAEMEMGDINAHLSNIGDIHYFEINTVMLMSAPQNRYISSSLIRGLPKTEDWEIIIKKFLPEHSAKEFIERNKK
jgi:pantetheine-phosphate adenylyltransferase